MKCKEYFAGKPFSRNRHDVRNSQQNNGQGRVRQNLGKGRDLFRKNKFIMILLKHNKFFISFVIENKYSYI